MDELVLKIPFLIKCRSKQMPRSPISLAGAAGETGDHMGKELCKKNE